MKHAAPATKPRPVLIVMSTLAALQVLTGGAALTDFIGERLAGLFILAVAALQAGMAVYLQGQVVPLADTAAYLDDDRDMVAGPASTLIDGAQAVVVAPGA